MGRHLCKHHYIPTQLCRSLLNPEPGEPSSEFHVPTSCTAKPPVDFRQIRASHKQCSHSGSSHLCDKGRYPQCQHVRDRALAPAQLGCKARESTTTQQTTSEQLKAIQDHILKNTGNKGPPQHATHSTNCVITSDAGQLNSRRNTSPGRRLLTSADRINHNKPMEIPSTVIDPPTQKGPFSLNKTTELIYQEEPLSGRA